MKDCFFPDHKSGDWEGQKEQSVVSWDGSRRVFLKYCNYEINYIFKFLT